MSRPVALVTGGGRGIIDEGCEAARGVARDTLDDVRSVMNLAYR